MRAPTVSFIQGAQRDFHRARARRLLREHPEVKSLIGPAPVTALFVLLLVALQTGLALGLSAAPWWLILLLAYTVGAVASLGLWVLIHECVHDLVFGRPVLNRSLALFANLPTLLPAASSFRKYHLLHHRHLGDPAMDGDLPGELEVRLVGRYAWRKALWLALMPILQSFRPVRIKAVPFVDRWFFLNATSQALFVLLLGLTGGVSALAYLLLSGVFSMGLHPLGARWIQEHFVFREGQETGSYYGPMNRLLFNAGYHNEHHDMMRVPWVHLPKLTKICPDMYEPLHAHRSWCALLFRFVFDRSCTLERRIARGAVQGTHAHDDQ
jgi:sphingolipid delta-4 desaturase